MANKRYISRLKLLKFVSPFASTALPSFSSINFDDLENASAPFLTGQTLGYLISILLGYIFPIAGLLLLLYILYGGYEIFLSTGDPKKVASGKGKITNGVVGFLIIFLAYWILQFLGRALGIQGILDIFG